MTFRRRSMRRAFAILALALAAPALAQEPDPLRGPALKDQPAKATLIERDFAGKLKRPDIPVEEAALPLLNLDAESRARVDAALAARAQVLDQIVVDNLELVVRLHNARQSGDRLDQLNTLAEFMKKL